MRKKKTVLASEKNECSGSWTPIGYQQADHDATVSPLFSQRTRGTKKWSNLGPRNGSLSQINWIVVDVYLREVLFEIVGVEIDVAVRHFRHTDAKIRERAKRDAPRLMKPVAPSTKRGARKCVGFIDKPLATCSRLEHPRTLFFRMSFCYRSRKERKIFPIRTPRGFT